VGAVGAGGRAGLGWALGRLPVPPRLGALLLEGQRRGCGARAALAAALLSERDPFARPADPATARAGPPTPSDVLDRVEALEAFERHGPVTGSPGPLSRAAARSVLRARDQLLRLLRPEAPAAPPASSHEAPLRAALAAFPDRLARRREAGWRRGVMVGGRGVRLAGSSGVTGPELFLCVDVDAGQGEALVRQASGVERDWLPPEKVTSSVEV